METKYCISNLCYICCMVMETKNSIYLNYVVYVVWLWKLNIVFLIYVVYVVCLWKLKIVYLLYMLYGYGN